MHKKKGKVYATLTEVKNLIGDVFAAVDQHGSVIITSYNKEKYVITKAKAPEMPEILDEVLEDRSAKTKIKPLHVPEPEITASSTPVTATSQPQEPVLEQSFADAGKSSVADESPYIAPQVPEIIESEPELNIPQDIFSIFRGIENNEIFARFSERELNWTFKARDNL